MARLYGPGPEPPPPLLSTSDLAGLSASDVEGRPVGELVGTLSEQASGLIRYLDVSIRKADRHVLVPIGHTRIDREAAPPRVRLRAATHDDLLSIPAFVPDGDGPGAPYQREVMSAHGRLFYGSRYYAHPAYDHGALWAGDVPIVVADGDAPDEPRDLRRISELSGFRIARSAPQLVGWPVRDAAGEAVGSVRDLLIEPASRRALYALVDLADLDRDTLLPIGYLEADPEAQRLRTPALAVDDIRLLPAYEPPLTRELENRLHASLEGRLTGPRYFDRPDFRPGAR